MEGKVLPIAPLSSNRVDQQKATIKQMVQPVIDSLEKYDIPDGKEENVIAFTLKYFARNQHMRPSRIVRKVVEQYHLQLKTEEDGTDKVQRS